MFGPAEVSYLYSIDTQRYKLQLINGLIYIQFSAPLLQTHPSKVWISHVGAR